MRHLSMYPPTYWVRTAHTASPTLLNGTKVLGYIWHPSTATSDLVLLRTEAHSHSGQNGYYEIELLTVSAQHATPGGTAPTPQKSDASDPDSACTVRSVPTGEPTMGSVALYTHLVDANTSADVEIEAHPSGKPLVVKGGVAGGYAVRVVVTDALTSAADLNVNFHWIEVPADWPRSSYEA